MKIDVWTPGTEFQMDRTLFLEPHPEYPTHYLVQSFNPLYIDDLKELIGEYSSVFQFKVDKLRELAEDKGYEQLFYMNDPKEVIERYDSLDEPYPYELGMDLKRFQLQGFNYCKELHSEIINWSTGTGKSVYAVAKAQYLLRTNKVDKVVVVSKGHNKINWCRQFKDVADLFPTIAEAPGGNAEIRRERRAEIYNTVDMFVINYEKLRFRPANGSSSGDGVELLEALKKKRVYFIWDEMPTRLKNPSTSTWKGANKIVKATSEAYQSMLSATPLENSPEDIYSCVKILDPTVFGNLDQFRHRYAKSFNPFMKWKVQLWDTHKLQEMGMRLAHMTHVANKYRDPEIRDQFPKEHWEDVFIDMSAPDEQLYTQVQKQLAQEFNLNPEDNILNKLLVLQLICNNPDLLNMSQSEIAKRIVEKKKPNDLHAAKLDTLHDLLGEVEGKVVLFSMYNDFGAKNLAKYLTQWGITNVLYNGTDEQKQLAQDRFMYDKRIKVFVSSDQGSDSINLEQATTVINYDLPWKYSTLLQRVNRINRITSDAEHVWYFNLITAKSMEERKMEILDRKRIMHEAIEDPSVEHSEAISTLTLADYKYILTGE